MFKPLSVLNENSIIQRFRIFFIIDNRQVCLSLEVVLLTRTGLSLKVSCFCVSPLPFAWQSALESGNLRAALRRLTSEQIATHYGHNVCSTLHAILPSGSRLCVIDHQDQTCSILPRFSSRRQGDEDTRHRKHWPWKLFTSSFSTLAFSVDYCSSVPAAAFVSTQLASRSPPFGQSPAAYISSVATKQNKKGEWKVISIKWWTITQRVLEVDWHDNANSATYI